MRSLRLLRVPDGPRDALLLQDGERYLQLSEHLGQAFEDLPGLLAAGMFHASRLEPLLVEGNWREVGPPERVLTPVRPHQVGKILALGKNVGAHAAEFGEEPPPEPMVFNKLPETLVPSGASVHVPGWYDGRFDHEAELAVVIGRRGRDILPESAFEHVAGYTLANDLTARTLQGDDRSKRHPWLRAKNFPGACPLGPALVPRDYLDVSDLRVTCTVERNGARELRQDASTRTWVHPIPAAIAWLSRWLTLNPGDLILMGTSAGVGPLEHGDRVVCDAAGIGELVTHIARPAP